MDKTLLRTKYKSCLLLCLIVTSNHYSQDILWEKSLGGKQAEYLFDAQPTADNGFILGGSSFSKKTGNKTVDSAGNLDYWIWKMNEKGDLEWQKSFGGEGTDLLQSIKITSDGGFILAGISNSNKGTQKKENCIGKEDFWVIKLNAKGDEEWQCTIGGNGQELLQSISQTLDGGYIVGGSSASDKSKVDISTTVDFNGKAQNSFGNLDYWIVKLNSKGKTEWQQSYGGESADILRGIKQTTDGGFVVGGYSNSPISGNKTSEHRGKGDYWIVKIDKKGNEEWQNAFGGEDDDQMYTIDQTFDGNFIVGGNSDSSTSGNKMKSNTSGSDIWLVKFEERGNILWQQTFNVGKNDFLTSFVENEDHSIVLGIYAKPEVLAKKKIIKEDINDYVAMKIDSAGEEIWRKSIGSNGEDILKRVIETRDGGYLLAGTSNGTASRDKNTSIGRNDFWIVKLRDKKKLKEKPRLIEAIPNPANTFSNVVVGYEYEKGTASLYDLNGRQLQTFSITGNRIIPMDLNGLPEGIYVVQIKTNKSNDSVKIIKGLQNN